MNVRRGTLVCAVLAVVAVLGLLAAAAQPVARRSSTLGAPNTIWLAVLRPTSRVCEGPIAGTSPTQSVAVWGAAGPSHRATLTVEVRDATTNKLLASVPVAAPAVEGKVTARLRRPLPAGRPVRICLTQDSGTFSLYGYTALNPYVTMTGRLIGPQPTNGRGEEFSLVLYDTASHSLLDSLGLAFSRAALWHPSWVGSWTFWILAAGLLGSFGLGVVAVAAAASADDADDGPGGDGSDDGGADLPTSPAETGDSPRTAAYG